MTGRNVAEAVMCGAIGAASLTVANQVARRVTDLAPRMDVIGMRGVTRAIRGAGAEPAARQRLYALTLAGDLLANSAYYSLAALGDRPNAWIRGTALGLAAGMGALSLPPRIGLGDPPQSEHAANRVMTVAWYVIGGLATAAAVTRLNRRQRTPV